MGRDQRKLINFFKTAAPSRASAMRILVIVLFGVGGLMIYTSNLLNRINMAIASLSDPVAMTQMQSLVLNLAFVYFVTFMIFLGGALIYLLVLRQRVAGPTIAICHFIRELKKGNYDYKRELRTGDELGEIMTELKDLAKTMKGNQRGFSTNGVLIAVVVIGAVVANFTFMYKNMMSGQTAIKYSTEVINFNDSVGEHLSNDDACGRTFRNFPMDESKVHPVTKILNADGSTKFEAGPLYGDRTLKIAKMAVKVAPVAPTSDTGEASLLMDYAPATESSGTPEKTREVLFSYRRDPVSKALLSCVAKVKMSDGLWRRSATVDDIFFGGGKVSIGGASARAALDVDGAILGKRAIQNTGMTVDFSKGNIQYTSAACGNFQLHNLADGGTYLFIVQGAVAGLCNFQVFMDGGKSPLMMHLPPDHGPTLQAKHTLYSFAVVGSHVYASWVPGY